MNNIVKKNIVYNLSSNTHLPFSENNDLNLKANQIIYTSINNNYQKMLQNDLYIEKEILASRSKAGPRNFTEKIDELADNTKMWSQLSATPLSILHKIEEPITKTLSSFGPKDVGVNFLFDAGVIFCGTNKGLYRLKDGKEFSSAKLSSEDFKTYYYADDINQLFFGASQNLYLLSSFDGIETLTADIRLQRLSDYSDNINAIRLNGSTLAVCEGKNLHLYNYNNTEISLTDEITVSADNIIKDIMFTPEGDIVVGTDGSSLWCKKTIYGFNNLTNLPIEGTINFFENGYIGTSKGLYHLPNTTKDKEGNFICMCQIGGDIFVKYKDGKSTIIYGTEEREITGEITKIQGTTYNSNDYLIISTSDNKISCIDKNNIASSKFIKIIDGVDVKSMISNSGDIIGIQQNTSNNTIFRIIGKTDIEQLLKYTEFSDFAKINTTYVYDDVYYLLTNKGIYTFNGDTATLCCGNNKNVICMFKKDGELYYTTSSKVYKYVEGSTDEEIVSSANIKKIKPYNNYIAICTNNNLSLYNTFNSSLEYTDNISCTDLTEIGSSLYTANSDEMKKYDIQKIYTLSVISELKVSSPVEQIGQIYALSNHYLTQLCSDYSSSIRTVYELPNRTNYMIFHNEIEGQKLYVSNGDGISAVDTYLDDGIQISADLSNVQDLANVGGFCELDRTLIAVSLDGLYAKRQIISGNTFITDNMDLVSHLDEYKLSSIDKSTNKNTIPYLAYTKGDKLSVVVIKDRDHIISTGFDLSITPNNIKFFNQVESDKLYQFIGVFNNISSYILPITIEEDKITISNPKTVHNNTDNKITNVTLGSDYRLRVTLDNNDVLSGVNQIFNHNDTLLCVDTPVPLYTGVLSNKLLSYVQDNNVSCSLYSQNNTISNGIRLKFQKSSSNNDHFISELSFISASYYPQADLYPLGLCAYVLHVNNNGQHYIGKISAYNNYNNINTEIYTLSNDEFLNFVSRNKYCDVYLKDGDDTIVSTFSSEDTTTFKYTNEHTLGSINTNDSSYSVFYGKNSDGKIYIKDIYSYTEDGFTLISSMSINEIVHTYDNIIIRNNTNLYTVKSITSDPFIEITQLSDDEGVLDIKPDTGYTLQGIRLNQSDGLLLILYKFGSSYRITSYSIDKITSKASKYETKDFTCPNNIEDFICKDNIILFTQNDIEQLSSRNVLSGVTLTGYPTNINQFIEKYGNKYVVSNTGISSINTITKPITFESYINVSNGTVIQGVDRFAIKNSSGVSSYSSESDITKLPLFEKSIIGYYNDITALSNQSTIKSYKVEISSFGNDNFEKEDLLTCDDDINNMFMYDGKILVRGKENIRELRDYRYLDDFNRNINGINRPVKYINKYNSKELITVDSKQYYNNIIIDNDFTQISNLYESSGKAFYIDRGQLYRFDGVNDIHKLNQIDLDNNNLHINRILFNTLDESLVGTTSGLYVYDHDVSDIYPIDISGNVNLLQKIVTNDYTRYYVYSKDNAIYRFSDDLIGLPEYIISCNYDINGYIKYDDYTNILGTTDGLFKTSRQYSISNDFLNDGMQSTLDSISAEYKKLIEQHCENYHGEGSYIEYINSLVKTNCNEITPEFNYIKYVDFNEKNLISVQTQRNSEIVNLECYYIDKVDTLSNHELYINIPTTNTYYICHSSESQNCNFREDTFKRPNTGKETNSNITIGKTTVSVLIDSSKIDYTSAVNVLVNGTSLPLKIYKDIDHKCGGYEQKFHSTVKQSTVSSINKAGDIITIVFKCFCTDEQSVKVLLRN